MEVKMENCLKHLIVAVGGIGLCYARQIIGTWFIPNGKDIITQPFTVVSVILIISGMLCCAGAMICELDRYKKNEHK
jgi:hypothetical protein